MWSLLPWATRTSMPRSSIAARTAAQRRSSSTVEIGVLTRSEIRFTDRTLVRAARLRLLGRLRVVEVLADRLEVGVARAAAPLGRDDLPAPLADALGRAGAAERAGRDAHGSRRRRSASQRDQSDGSGRAISIPSAASRPTSHARTCSRWAAGERWNMPF